MLLMFLKKLFFIIILNKYYSLFLTILNNKQTAPGVGLLNI